MVFTRTRWEQVALLAAAIFLSVEATSYRLPGYVVPESYQLSIVPYINSASNSTFEGTVNITAYVKEKTESIVLHAHETLDVNVLSVTSLNTSSQLNTTTSRNTENDFLTISVGETLSNGSWYRISMNFSGNLSTEENYGFYLSSYKVDNNTTTKLMATTHFQPTYARRAFPCFDEPMYRATFNITIARLSTQISLSNMPLKSSSESDSSIGNRTRDTFEETPKMPSYLVAFVVSELSKVSTSSDNISVYVRSNAEDKVTLAVDLAPKVLKEVKEFTSVGYPLPKLDLVAIPDLPVEAMENWGLITFREGYLFNSSASSTDHSFTVAKLVTKKIIQQWFGDLVTLQWWSSPWLKEGLAGYLQYLILDDATGGEYHATGRIGCDDLQSAMEDDAKENAYALTDTDLVTTEEILKHLVGLTATKGTGMFRMIKTMLGESLFKKGLKEYLNKYKYSYATVDQTAAIFEALAYSNDVDVVKEGSNLTIFVELWSEQSGFPVIIASRMPSDYPYLRMKEARFMSQLPSNSSEASEADWDVPYGVYWQGEDIGQNYYSGYCPFSFASRCNILDMSHSAKEFYAFDWGQTGFYRVNYDILNFRKLCKNITNHAFDGGVVAGMLDDALALARVRTLNTTDSLTLVRAALPSQRTTAPWKMVSGPLKSMLAVLRGQEEIAEIFTMFVGEFLLADAYSAINWTGSNDTQESFDIKVTRSIVVELACMFGVASCRETALQAFKDNQDDLSKIHTDVLGPTVCEALLQDVENASYVYGLYRAEEDISRRAAYLYGLGCVQNTTTATWLLDEVLASSASYDVMSLSKSLIDHNDTGAQFMVDFAANNYAKINSSLGEAGASSLLQYIAERICSEDQLEQMNTLDDSISDSNLNTSLRVAMMNLIWASIEGIKIQQWVDSLLANETSTTETSNTTSTASSNETTTVTSSESTTITSSGTTTVTTVTSSETTTVTTAETTNSTTVTSNETSTTVTSVASTTTAASSTSSDSTTMTANCFLLGCIFSVFYSVR